MDTITKTEIIAAGLTRLELAEAMGMNYSCLSAKMSGFQLWKGDELDRARAILARHNKAKAKANGKQEAR